DLVTNAERRGRQLADVILGLSSDLVTGVRGQGLLLGVALAHPVASAVVTAALGEGLIVNAANPETVRLVPPLNIGDAEVAEFGERFAEALRTVEAVIEEGDA